MDVVKAKQYIENLVLPPIPDRLKGIERKPLSIKDNEESAVVSDGSIISFTKNLKGIQKSDTQNSALLAQLAASQAFDRFENPDKWIKKYVEVLMNIAWMIQDLDFIDLDIKSAKFEMDKAIIELISAISTDEEKNLLKNTFESLQSPDNENAYELFSSSANNNTLGNFQILTATISGGDVILPVAATRFETTTHQRKFLWFSWSSVNIKFFYSKQVVV